MPFVALFRLFGHGLDRLAAAISASPQLCWSPSGKCQCET